MNTWLLTLTITGLINSGLVTSGLSPMLASIPREEHVRVDTYATYSRCVHAAQDERLKYMAHNDRQTGVIYDVLGWDCSPVKKKGTP